MAAATDEMKMTFRRYKDGDSKHRPWQEEIWNASWTHKCPTYVHRTPPCQGSCPSGHDIRGWLDIVRGVEKPTAGKGWQEYAFRRAVNANPFPAVMGRVCPAPCEDGCNRNQVEDHVGINSVEQFLGDWAIQNQIQFDKPAQESGKKVAIIGGGPAGLAAAYQLRRMGHGVTIFESNAQLGGMMRYGIPGYRTPRHVLDAEIQRIINMGVEVKVNTKVGKDITLEQIEKEYNAVFWGIGVQVGRGLPIPGAEAPNCISGVSFLRAFNDGRLQHVTGKVVVIGGGDTSIDVASVARRLGHISASHEKDRAENIVLGNTAHDVASAASREGADVLLISRQPIDKMNAAQHEIDDALREGVKIKGSLTPVSVVLDGNGRAKALKVAELDYSTGKAIEKPGSEFEIEADLIVSAIGQMGDFVGFESLNNGKGLISADKTGQVAGKPGHFVSGDIVRPHLLTTAIGQAAVAAESIDRYLKGESLVARPKVDARHFKLMNKLDESGLSPKKYEVKETRGTCDADFAVHNFEDRCTNEIIPHDQLFLGHFSHTPRNKRKHRTVDSTQVLGDFAERIVCLDEKEAVAEAKRCMSCGLCFECDNCVIYCPQEAVKRTPKKSATTGRYVYTDYSRCIGCHICADVCPTGYIQMGMGE